MSVNDSQRAAIVALGSDLSPHVLETVAKLYEAEQRHAMAVLATAVDVPYGSHEQQRLDVYSPGRDTRHAPILIWVHGGGFVRGDKGNGETGHWLDANIGSMAARLGMIGVVINYRLAPQHPWPAGSEDLAAAVDWVKQHAADYAGDPSRIVLAGSSAGAVHVAGYLKLRPDHATDVRGAILLSGLYGVTTADDVRDLAYYGNDVLRHADMMPLDAVTETQIPLLVACAEFDPLRFQTEFLGLLQRRLARHGRMPRAYVGSGHNHFSLAFHLGGADARLADEIKSFVDDLRKNRFDSGSDN